MMQEPDPLDQATFGRLMRVKDLAEDLLEHVGLLTAREWEVRGILHTNVTAKMKSGDLGRCDRREGATPSRSTWRNKTVVPRSSENVRPVAGSDAAQIHGQVSR